MNLKMKLFRGALAAVALAIGTASQAAPAEHTGQYLAPANQVVAIKAGKLYDPKAGVMLSNQVVIIHGDRIAAVGPNLPIPAGAKVIDLSAATVMPGMTDAHVHLNVEVGHTSTAYTPAERALWIMTNAQIDLKAGFTTLLDMDSRGGFNTVDLRDMINAGVVLGPRLQVVGQSLNYRNNAPVKDFEHTLYYSGITEDKNVNGPWLARAAVREAKNHGVDYVKLYSTEDYDANTYMWAPDGTFQYYYSITTEEVEAIVDEAHRLGLKVACHSYGGNAKDPCLIAGVDHPNHLLSLDADGVKMLLAKHLPFTATIDDLVFLQDRDKAHSKGETRLHLLELAVRRAHAAGVELAFGSGVATEPWGDLPHGIQGDQFAWFQKWGLSPVEALRMTYIAAPRVLNYHMDQQIGTIEPGKYADIIAVAGNPLNDLTEMQRVKFVMKGGFVVVDKQTPQAQADSTR